MLMKILCIGHSSWDITVPVDEYPIENTKYRYNEKYSLNVPIINGWRKIHNKEKV